MTLADTLVYYYRRWRYRDKPLPKIDVPLRRTLPGWLLRLAAAALAMATPALAGYRSFLPIPVTAILIGLVGVWMLLRPGYAAATTSIGVAGVFLLISEGAPFQSVTPWVVAAAYLTLRLAMVAALLPWRSKAEIGALGTWRDLVVLGLSGLVGAVILLPGRPVGWVAVVGTAALLATGLILAGRNLRHHLATTPD